MKKCKLPKPGDAIEISFSKKEFYGPIQLLISSIRPISSNKAALVRFVPNLQPIHKTGLKIISNYFAQIETNGNCQIFEILNDPDDEGNKRLVIDGPHSWKKIK